MSTLGNIIWLLFGGLIVALIYIVFGLIMCCTIIGIPFGLQLIKIGGLALMPFGKDVEIMDKSGCLALGFNIIWVLCGWWELAIIHFVFSCIFAITIIGLPFAKAHWRLMKMSLFPFGSRRK